MSRTRRETILVVLYGLTALSACLWVGSWNQSIFTRLSYLAFDAYQRSAPRPQTQTPVVLVDVDEASLSRFGQWPWPRLRLADLVDRLREAGAAAIAFDMVFPEPDRTSPTALLPELQRTGYRIESPSSPALDYDHALAAAFARAPVVAGLAISNERENLLPKPKTGIAFGGSDPTAVLASYTGGIANLPLLQDAASGAGFFSFPPSSDGIVRQVPLIANARGAIYPALALEALRVAQGAGAVLLRLSDASGEAGLGAPVLTEIKVGDFAASVGATGDFWIYYSGLPALKTLSAADVLAKEKDLPDLSGMIVIVGTSAIGLRDLVATPIAASMPGMRVHAEIIDQILSGNFLSRPDWAPGAERAAAIVFGLAITLLARATGSLVLSAMTSGFVIGCATLSWFAFREVHLLLDPVFPSVTALIVFGTVMPVMLLLTSREKKFVRSAFGHYLAPALVERLAENPGALRLGGELRELTVLFCDIRGFTSLSEGMNPEELTTLLNNFLTPMSDVLLKSSATIDKYIGDAIMAFWNAPVDLPDHRRHACLAALEMVAAVARLNETQGYALRIGIGLNAGMCCVGNLGSAQRFSYSAIGDGVNVASRVEGLSKVYGLPIVITESVAMGLEDLAILPIDVIRVYGRQQPIRIFTLLGDAELATHAAFHLSLAAQQRWLAAYRDGNAERAAAALADARANDLFDLAGLHALYEKRLQLLIQRQPGQDWDGIALAEGK